MLGFAVVIVLCVFAVCFGVAMGSSQLAPPSWQRCPRCGYVLGHASGPEVRPRTEVPPTDGANARRPGE